MKKQLKEILALCSFVALATTAARAIDANTMPVLNSSNSMVNGTVTTNGNTMTVKTVGGAGAVGQFDWKTFNVGSNSTVNFAATAHSQTSLNRVIGGQGMSQIYGKLMSSCATAGCSYGDTLKVILYNPQGLLFGNGSQVNMNSFTATTFDAVGAKNINSLSGAALESYTSGLKGKFGPGATIQFRGSENQPGAEIKLDGSTWNIDKSAAIVAKDITYKGSKLSTSVDEYNYNGNQNFSNVKLVTSNGVDFVYTANGYLKNDVAVEKGLDGVDYNINIGDGDSNKDVDSTITSGSVFIKNRGMTEGSNINVRKTAIKGMKLINNAYGDIYIVGNSKVAVKDSSVETFNIMEEDNSSVNTFDKIGGNILIRGGQGVEIDNTKIATAYSTVADEYGNADQTDGYPGDVTIEAAYGGNAVVKNSTINSKGGVYVKANEGKAEVKDSTVKAMNIPSTGNKEDIAIYGKEAASVSGSDLYATGNVSVKSAGNVDLTNNGRIYAGSKLDLVGANTTIDNSALSYNTISLTDGDTNNVTIKNASTFQDRAQNKLVLNVKGDLTVSNASLKTKTPLGDDAANQTSIELNATGNTSIQDNSDITAVNAISVNNPTGKIAVTSSKLTSQNSNVTLDAKNNVDVTSSALTAQNAVKATSANADVNVNASNLTGKSNQLIATLGNANVSKSTLKAETTNTVTAKKNVNVDCSTVDGANNTVTAQTGKATVKDSTFKATNKNNIIAQTDLEVINSIIKGTSNSLKATTGKLTDINSTIEGKVNSLVAAGDVEITYDKNYTTTCTGAGCGPEPKKPEIKGEENNIESGDDIIIGGLVIVPGTDHPEDTVTVFSADGDIKTKAVVVYDDLYDKTGTIVGEGALDTGKTKVVFDTKGDVNLVLANTDNPKAGLEITNGKKVELIAANDGTNATSNSSALAISRIKANDLYIHEGNKFIAGETVITDAEIARLKKSYAESNPEELQTPEGVDANIPGRGYIAVAHGFNFDYEPARVEVGGIYESSFNQITDGDGNVTGYADHFINLDPDTTNGKFVLAYEKPFACDPLPDIEPDVTRLPDILSDETALVKIPLQADNITLQSVISNNVTDPMYGVVAAAAGVDADEDDQLDY